MTAAPLAADLKEAEALLQGVQSARLRGVLEREIAQMKVEVAAAEKKAKDAADKEKAAAVAPAATAAAGVPSVKKEIKSYSWEQTAKTLTIRATYPQGWGPLTAGCETSTSDADNLLVSFAVAGKGTLLLSIKDLEKPVDVSRMTFKFKDTYVMVKVPKQTEGMWINLKTKDLGQNKLGKDSDDPTQGLMNMMKNLYDDGDAEMKQQIAKAMYEGRNKQGMM